MDKSKIHIILSWVWGTLLCFVIIVQNFKIQTRNRCVETLSFKLDSVSAQIEKYKKELIKCNNYFKETNGNK